MTLGLSLKKGALSDMVRMKRRTNGRAYGIAVAVVLAISIVFGFVFDFVCTKIEHAIYKKPAEYQGYVSEYSLKYDVPENLIYAVMKTESGFDFAARSSVGAQGLMQLMPNTFLWLTNDMLGDRYEAGMLYDPETNIKYGVYYLSYLYDRYGNWDTALAAYNAGPGNVDSWLGDSEYDSDGDGVLDKIPFRETRKYVKKVNKSLKMYDKLY